MEIIFIIIGVLVSIILSLVIGLYLVFAYQIYKVQKKSDIFIKRINEKNKIK